MGYLTTHILDTAQGKPAQAVEVSLYKVGESLQHLKTLQTNSDGRTDSPILAENEFEQGTFELKFKIGEYFDRSEMIVDSPPFLDEIALRFSMSNDDHYHVPLLVSPWSYSTYRGS